MLKNASKITEDQIDFLKDNLEKNKNDLKDKELTYKNQISELEME